MHEAAACSFIPMDRICRLSKHHDLFSPLSLMVHLGCFQCGDVMCEVAMNILSRNLLEHYNGCRSICFGFRRYFQFTKTVLPTYAANISVWSSSSPHPYQQLISPIIITVHTPSNLSKYRDDLRDSMLQMQSFTYSLNH